MLTFTSRRRLHLVHEDIVAHVDPHSIVSLSLVLERSVSVQTDTCILTSRLPIFHFVSMSVGFSAVLSLFPFTPLSLSLSVFLSLIAAAKCCCCC